MSEVRFHTPEDVEIAYRPAGPGTRYVAVFVDQLLIAVLTVVVGLGLVMLGAGVAPFFDRLGRSLDGDGPASALWFSLAVLFLVKFALDTLYYIFFETLMHGQTPGKRVMKIQVIHDGGYPLDPLASVVRNLMRIVDNLPLCWPVPLFSPEHKRIGDYVAGTIVVSKRPGQRPTGRLTGPLYSELEARQYEFTAEHLAALGQDDAELIDSYLERRPTLKPQVVDPLRRRICDSVRTRLGVDVPPTPGDEDRFIEELAAFLREQSLRRQI